MTLYRKILSPIDGQARQDFVLRDDGAFIPADPRNTDWQAYQAWREAGNELADPQGEPTQGAVGQA